MKKLILIIIVIFLSDIVNAQQPKVISDCTISFSIGSSDHTKQEIAASSTIYIKGKDIRTDLINNSFSQTIFYNDHSGNATVLKTMGQSKYIASYTADEWKKENEIYSGIAVSITGNTKKILNYECKEAILTLKNGKAYTVYFTPLLIPSVRENPFEFKNIPGLVLEFQASTNENEKLFYTANNISFNPVPAAQFEIPKNGYRILH